VRIKHTLVLLILAVFAVAPSSAQEYTAIGLGNSSCGSWTAARRDKVALPYQQWVIGFLSGIGYAKPYAGLDPLKGLDGNAVYAWVDNYCGANPLNDISVAGNSFIWAHPGK